jgi:hypothetical protein
MGDSMKQARFLRELGKTYPEAVIHRYESANFAIDEAVTKEYLKVRARHPFLLCILHTSPTYLVYNTDSPRWDGAHKSFEEFANFAIDEAVTKEYLKVRHTRWILHTYIRYRGVQRTHTRHRGVRHRPCLPECPHGPPSTRKSHIS